MIIGLGIGIPFIRNYVSSVYKEFSPLDLFTTGVNGAWYDPSDFSTMFQDAAGTTPVTAVGQPVGLMLDKSKGLALGSELVINGGFATDTWWLKGAGCTISGGLGVAAAAGNGSGFYKTGLLTIGAYYEITFTIVSCSAGAFRVGFFSAAYSTAYSTPGTYTIRLKADGTGFVVETVGTTTGSIDNVSVKQVTGNHAYNPSGNSANFPVLSCRYNILNNTDVLATQSVTTRAAKYILSFYGTGSVAMSGTYSGTLLGTDANNRVYVEFTATAGNLTLTVSGSVTKAQLEEL